MMHSALLEGLNPSQIAAATAIEGPLLILAGPGSGKTRVITHRIAYMIQQGVDPRGIVALTFTNKAAGEMRSRVERIVGHSDVWMGTFHSFCVRLLRRYARLVGLTESFSIYDTDDAQSALLAAVKTANFELTHMTLGKLANRISYFKNRLVTPEILAGESLSSYEHQVSQVYPHYQRILLENSAVDFDDILMHVAHLLRSHPELRGELDARCRYLMVDEYQDTNLAQYVIMRHLSVDFPNLAVTGDPDQSIYGWRGANIKNVTQLEKDYPNLRVLRLEENYRSTPEILSLADSLIQHNQFRKAKVLVPLRSTGQPVRLSIYPSARSEAEDIADQIAAAVMQGDFRFADFGVLYRTNAHSRHFEHALTRRQIPFQLIGGFRFYARKEIKDLLAYLLLIHNPDDNVALQRAINTPPRGIGKQTLDKLFALAAAQQLPLLEAARQAVAQQAFPKRSLTGIAGFLKIYDQLCRVAHGPLLELLQMALSLTDYEAYLLKQQRGTEREIDVQTNLDELLAEARELDQAPDSERSPLEMLLEMSALQSEADRLADEHDRVTLMTLHAAKGLEFRCVYVTAIEENVLPHIRSKDDPLSLEEERRLLFVGITRAKDQLQLSYAKSRGFDGQGGGVPSSFLLELPRSQLRIDDRSDPYAGYEGIDRGFDDDLDEFDQRPPNEWDDSDDAVSEGSSGDSTASLDFDEACQLPPEELQARRAQQAHRKSPPPKIRPLAEEMDDDLNPVRGGWGAFRVGCVVVHPHYGEGEIIAASGLGPKRSVTIKFFADSSRHTFRLSHSTLKIQN